MAAAAIWDCRIHKILLADRVWRAQTHHCTKFHQNWSFHCGDIAILQIFKMAATAILDFWNRAILSAIVVERVQTHQRAKLCQIRPIVCEILRFFRFFSRWRPPPSWIFEIVNFYLLTVSGGPSRITVPNFVKIGRSVTDILRFFEFSRWPPPQSWIFENVKFYSLLGSRVARRISMPNLVINWSISCEDIKIFRFFNMAAAAIVYFRNSDFLFAAGICGF